MAYLIKTHEKSGLLVCSNGSVFIPESRRYKEHWTCGSLCGRYRIVHHNGKNYSVHRMVAETFLENPNNYQTVDHIDRNRLNNDVTNLRWASYSMQMRNTSQNESCYKKNGTHYYEDMKKCRNISSSNYVKTPKGKEVHSKAMKKWRSKFKRLKFNDGKVHYVPLEKAKEIEHLPVYQRILKNIKE
jgi:hypothetical protein